MDEPKTTVTIPKTTVAIPKTTNKGFTVKKYKPIVKKQKKVSIKKMIETMTKEDSEKYIKIYRDHIGNFRSSAVAGKKKPTSD
jgi:hypothetical protein